MHLQSNYPISAQPASERGSALIIVVILLLLASTFTVFALNVGVFEQRTVGNDVRAKLVHEIAEAGANQASEVLNLDRALIDTTNAANWQLCGAGDDTFPCGAMDAGRRATVYRFIGGNIDVDGNGTVSALEQRYIPIQNRIQSVGGFNVRYGVGALICRVRKPDPAAPPGAPAECATNPADETSTFTVTLVSKAEIPAEGSSATVSTTIGGFALINIPTGIPPVVASGTIDVTGNMQLVTNPNGGGNGVPVSMWTRRDVDKTGTPNTCYLDEFLRDGGSGQDGTLRWYQGMPICHNCDCPSSGSLSYSGSGNKQCEGIDILDVDNNLANDPACPYESNRDVRPEEFPCDLFEYVFGVKAWSDTDGDHFCETAVRVEDPKNPGNQINADILFLRDNAKLIITNSADCSKLNAASSGLIWDRVGCDLKNQLGSPNNPVILVVDQHAKYNAGFNSYGMVFVRATDADADHTVKLSATTGGNATISAQGHAAIYGTIVVQGRAEKLNGTLSVVFNGDLLQTFNKSPENIAFGALPGAWTDRVRY